MHVEKINSKVFGLWNITLRITSLWTLPSFLHFRYSTMYQELDLFPSSLKEPGNIYIVGYDRKICFQSLDMHPVLKCCVLFWQQSYWNKLIFNIKLLTSTFDIFKYDLQNTVTMWFYTSRKCYKPHWSFPCGVTTTKCPCWTSCNNKQTI